MSHGRIFQISMTFKLPQKKSPNSLVTVCFNKSGCAVVRKGLSCHAVVSW